MKNIVDKQANTSDQVRKLDKFLTLPYEVLLIIMKMLSIKELLNISATSKYLNAITKDDSIWISKGKQYHVKLSGNKPVSAKQAFQHFLPKYGKILGVYLPDEADDYFVKVSIKENMLEIKHIIPLVKCGSFLPKTILKIAINPKTQKEFIIKDSACQKTKREISISMKGKMLFSEKRNKKLPYKYHIYHTIFP